MRQRALAPYLVGRQQQLAELTDHLDRARSGAGGVVMISGEAGVGKTRLLRELRDRLAGEIGVVVSVGHCYEDGPSQPYGPFSDMLGRFDSAVNPAVAELRRLLPKLAAGADGDGSLDPQAERRQLFQAIYEALRPEHGRTRLLILEDLHWSDQASLDLLLYLARAVEDERVLIVGTFRSDEMHRLHPLAALIARLTRDRRYHEVALGPLSRAELDELLAATIGGTPEPELLGALYERTEGNPFFAEEVLEALMTSGVLDARAPARHLGAIPLSIKDSILRRAADLDEATTAVVRAAAVAGRRFDFELLQRLTGLDEGAMLRSLSLLVERQLIAEEPGEGEDSYRFRHELVREALYEEMLRRERRMRHQEVLRALEAMHAADLGAVVDQLAYHAIRARALPEAARYSLQAGDRAARVHAYREALSHYEAALEAAEQADDHDVRGRAALLSRLGHTADQIGDPRRAAGFWREALPLYEALGEHRRAADVLRWLGRAAWDTHDSEGAFAQTRAALAALEGRGPCRELAMAYSALAHLYMFQIYSGDRAAAAAECIAWAEKALAMAEALGDDQVRSHALNSIGVAMAENGQPEAGAAQIERSLAIALQADLPVDAVRAYINLGNRLYYQGRREQGLTLLREGWEYGSRHGYLRGTAKLLSALAYVELETGAWDDLERRVDEVLRPSYSGPAEHRFIMTESKATLLWARGHYAHARELLEALLKSAGSQEECAGIEHSLLNVYRGLGEQAKAEALADSVLTHVRSTLDEGAPLSSLGDKVFKLYGVALCYLQIGRGAEATAIVEAMEAVAAKGDDTVNSAVIHELRGLAQLARQPATAAARFAQALQLFEQQGCRLDAIRLRRCQGDALLRHGTEQARAEARRVLAAARADAEALSFAFELAKITALEAQLTTPAQSRAASAHQPRSIDGLTPREHEVLALITRGLSNRAIAETLVISEKTAEVHVRNILGKLGFSSRTQAATFAVERGIVARSA
jgi:DNA-binding CsgD family transcriptional regulator/tetratricopeptide (TPR) repeat protein